MKKTTLTKTELKRTKYKASNLKAGLYKVNGFKTLHLYVREYFGYLVADFQDYKYAKGEVINDGEIIIENIDTLTVNTF